MTTESMAANTGMRALPPAIFLMGPTASGKTALAIELAQQLPCDLISVDSALIYRTMDIGTAKPTAEELQLAPHQLIDILDPAESYSVAQFRKDALNAMAASHAKGRIPLLVGGTMMYFKALLEGISKLPESDPDVRSALQQEAQTSGWQSLHDRLAEVDPESAQRIHPNDPQRLLRALEVYQLAGKSMTELNNVPSEPIPYNVVQFAIAPEQRQTLHERIAQRFQLMLEAGFQQEVEALMARGDLHLDLPSMRCVGYRQMWHYLEGKIDQQGLLDTGIAATRQLAKRQLTWLRGWQNLHWLETFDQNQAKKTLDIIQERFND